MAADSHASRRRGNANAAPRCGPEATVPARKGRPTKDEAPAIHAGILEAAARLFMRDGFTTSMDSIAAAARVSKRTLYAYYPSKMDLYEAVLTWLSGELAEPAAALPMDVPLDEALGQFCDYLLDLYTRPKVVAFAQLIQKESSRFPELDVASRQQFDEHILQPLKTYLDRRRDITLRDIDTRIAARVLCAVATVELTRMHAQNDLQNVENFRALMKDSIDLLLHGILQR